MHARRTLIAGNWKLHKTIKESIELVTLLKRSLSDVSGVDIVVCPPFTALAHAAEVLMETDIRLGAQDLFWEDKGAFTGEMSAPLLKDAGAEFVIIGHSERRQFFGDTEETVNQKTKAAIRGHLRPIVCVGETLAEREKSVTFQVLERQVKGGLSGLSEKDLLQCVIAYEPVWAIGTGKIATPQQAQEAHHFIRQQIKILFGETAAASTRILYGGSVKADNAASLMSQPDIDGALVGGASLDAQSFSDIVKSASAVGVK